MVLSKTHEIARKTNNDVALPAEQQSRMYFSSFGNGLRNSASTFCDSRFSPWWYRQWTMYVYYEVPYGIV